MVKLNRKLNPDDPDDPGDPDDPATRRFYAGVRTPTKRW